MIPSVFSLLQGSWQEARGFLPDSLLLQLAFLLFSSRATSGSFGERLCEGCPVRASAAGFGAGAGQSLGDNSTMQRVRCSGL